MCVNCYLCRGMENKKCSQQEMIAELEAINDAEIKKVSIMTVHVCTRTQALMYFYMYMYTSSYVHVHVHI